MSRHGLIRYATSDKINPGLKTKAIIKHNNRQATPILTCLKLCFRLFERNFSHYDR